MTKYISVCPECGQTYFAIHGCRPVPPDERPDVLARRVVELETQVEILRGEVERLRGAQH